MAFAVGDILEVKLVSDIPGEIAINVRHYRVTSNAGAGAPEGEVANDVYAYFVGSLIPLMYAGATFRRVEVAKVRPLPRGLAYPSNVASNPGTALGNLLPPQVTGIITLLTALAGRANRGRVYIPYPTENFSTADGRPEAAYVTALTTLAAKLDDDITAAAGVDQTVIRPVIYHRATGTSTDVIAYHARDYFATQRRRTNAA